MNKPFLLISAFSFLITTQGFAAQLVDLSVTQVKSISNKAISNVPEDLSELLGATKFEKLKTKSQINEGNVNHNRYFQTFKGVQVWPQEIAASVKNSRLHRLNGVFVRDLNNDIKSVVPKIKSFEALQLAKNIFHSKSKAKTAWITENEKTDLRIFVDSEKSQGTLVYIVTFFADTASGGKPTRPLIIINANTGELIKTIEKLTTSKGRGPGGNLKTGEYAYGKDFPEFEVTEKDNVCKMEAAKIKTIDLKNTTSGTAAYSFACHENIEPIINGAYGPLNDAHFFAGVISGLYKDWYNTEPLKIPITMRVHYSKNYENAFWNGTSMTFGDGAKRFYPLVSLDVSSHEIAHGFTEFNSNLDYAGQSGGINEAFSDMAGESAEYYANGKNDFQIGAEIFKTSGAALRYMFDPPKDGKSIGNAKDFTTGLDVHYSSGVFNKAFYILATTKGWTTKTAFDVFVKANQVYWTPTTDFKSGAKGVKDAAEDLKYSTDDVVAAFSKVGIDF